MRRRPLDDDVLGDAEQKSGRFSDRARPRADFGLAIVSGFDYNRGVGARSLSTATTHEEIWMRPRRPYITTLADVTINRSGESAVITYRDAAVRPVVFAIGPDIDRYSDAEILARFNDSLHAARAQTEGRQHVVVEIPRGHDQTGLLRPGWPVGATRRSPSLPHR
jgi:hypothetical protein